jgi:hypothetical protein
MVVRAVNNNSGREILDAEIANKARSGKRSTFALCAFLTSYLLLALFAFLSLLDDASVLRLSLRGKQCQVPFAERGEGRVRNSHSGS